MHAPPPHVAEALSKVKPTHDKSAGGATEQNNKVWGLGVAMPITPALRAKIQPDMALSGFSRTAVGEGLRTLRMAGAEKVAQGVTTVEEVLRVTREE